ncbi:hypothetical protein SLNWT_1363 [Streptomyces albus]|uniref:DUF317 domain-containing protein n=1 Tax=Streptomyces albus (strain ATCC 21838 / DSM 41398 / FERM P-419 / JCM 4703 / NBRC 107858) TaxID=1081613 RepID=A0A0B5EJR6_STRA4|nr:hypothetical protein SLNWT_1363 [Streptomyces albus]AOU76055.1 hypothetical protein SLNHY_1364 [Streptomyces albus]AYN31854.1 DUF317 domain-containing protein [Streptomyces albus]
MDITPRLREEIDTEWTWANYPMHWCTRDEIREVSNDAQKIHDDIRSGRLIIHAHAHDGWTTVAVGTYRDGPSVHLHGENHLRVEAGQYDNPATAIAEFQRLYNDGVRPGPAPATDTELEAEQARTPPAPEHDAEVQPSTSAADSARPDADGMGDHEKLLTGFVEADRAWERWRTWSDETTHAVHESLVLRAEFVHEAEPGDTQWKIAAYESPVGERRWHAAASTTVPVEIMRVLLGSLASADAAEIAAGSEIAHATIREATRPLADAGWELAVDGRFFRWQAPGDHLGGLQFDALAANAQRSHLPAWTFWGDGTPDSPGWTLRFSPRTAAAVLQDVASEMAVCSNGPRAAIGRQSRLRTASAVAPQQAPAPTRTR